MNRKVTSLLLLALAFAVGVASADYPAFAAGQAALKSSAAVPIVLLLGVGVYGWYRIVKTAAAEQQRWHERELRLSGR